MPEPIKRGQRYMPGLDGLRATAVIAVIAYHLKFRWAPGGLLGVGVFFTLSGYLITDLLLAQAARGSIGLKGFWLARARRLLPGLFVMLLFVMAWVTVIGPHQPPDFRTSAVTAAFYVNNWWLILHDVSYFQAFAAPPPLNHLWSLSIEEQFYIVWPFLMILGLRFVPEVESSTGTRVRLAGVTLGLALASGVLMAVLYRPGIDPSRVYYGTDTRMLEILTGAALAMVWPSRRLQSEITIGARRIIDALGAVGLAGIVVMFWRSQEYSPFLYRGGFLLLSVSTVLAVAALAHPASRLGPIIGCSPMRWIGERSYGIYLWHFPIIVLTTPEGAKGVDLARAIPQVAATITIAALSWRYIENPIRHGALARLWSYLKAGRWRRQTVPRRGWAALAGGAGVLIPALAGLAGVGVGPAHSTAPGNVRVSKTVTAARSPVRAKSTSCHSVIHIGDSTSDGLVSAQYLPNRTQRISAQYARVGATTQHFEISGARSIHERFEGLPNAADVASAWRTKRFQGCWVLALGTNEAANVAAGSSVGYDQRIDSMMSTIGRQPVLWVNVKSLVTSGPYAAPNMQAWDAALVSACRRYPTMRVYDWASDVRDAWFIPDGIHFTTPGYAARGRLIADALLEAFPAGRSILDQGSGCVVHPPDTSPAVPAPIPLVLPHPRRHQAPPTRFGGSRGPRGAEAELMLSRRTSLVEKDADGGHLEPPHLGATFAVSCSCSRRKGKAATAACRHVI
jgi:peptidoglycan/LPS O-acetylase OafA/YrhL